jgi:hypothetical protein
MSNNFFNKDSWEVEDTNTFFKISYEKNDFNLNEFSIKEVISFIEEIPSRDSFELRLEIDGLQESIINKIDKHKIIQFFNDYRKKKEEVNFELFLEVKKNKYSNVLSIYSFNVFLDFLEEKKLIDCIELFSNMLNEKIIFEVLDNGSKVELYTKSIAIINRYKDLNNNLLNFVNRKEKNKLFSENKIITNIHFNSLLADDFHIIYGDNNRIIDLFQKIESILSFASVVNTFTLSENNTFEIKISGYKTISIDNLDMDFFNGKDELLYRIYEWAYDGGNGTDKIGLIRNVLSLHLDSGGKVKIDSEVWDAIHSNYQIYLKENIQSYLEIKNKIGEFILELSSKTYSMADDVLNTFKNNVLLLLTFIISVVVVNGIKDNGIDKIFSLEYIFVILFLSVMSIVWFCLLEHEIIKRFDKATSNVRSILVRNYRQIIMQSEIDNTLKPVILKNKKYLKSQIKVLFKYLLIAIFLINAFFWLGNYISIKKTNEKTDIQTNESVDELLNNAKKHLKELDILNNKLSNKLIKEIDELKSTNDKIIEEREIYEYKVQKVEKENKILLENYNLLNNNIKTSNFSDNK